jgi:hypothetical protein
MQEALDLEDTLGTASRDEPVLGGAEGESYGTGKK